MQKPSPQVIHQDSVVNLLEPKPARRGEMESQQPEHIGWYTGAQAFLALDFVLLLPLGPDLAASLGFAAGHLGWLSGAYSGGALLAGLACVAWLDRLPRKLALLTAFALLSLAALAQGWVQSFIPLVGVRFVQGLVSAPVAALLLAVVIEQTAPSQRGRVMGQVFTGFTLAMVLGVPLALWGAEQLGWRGLLISLALLQLLWCGLGLWAVPRLSGALPATDSADVRPALGFLWANASVRRGLLAQGCNGLACFLIVPSFSAFYLSNLAWPREHLAPLYLFGGLATFVALRAWGQLVDAYSPARALSLALVLSLCGLLPLLLPGQGLGPLPHGALLALCFCAFMAANACRQLSLSAYCADIPAPSWRGAYLSLEHSVQDGAAALGALVASLIFSLLPPAGPSAHLAFAPEAWVWLVCLAMALFAAARLLLRPLPAPQTQFLRT